MCTPDWGCSGEHASVCSAGSVRLPFWFSPRVLCVCVRSRSRGVRAPPPPPRVGVARAPSAVPVLGAGRAVQLGLCPSACPASVPCSVWLAWGVGRPGPVSPYLAWGCALRVGMGAGVGTRHQPNSARSCELALRAALACCRGSTRAPGGGAPCLGAGRPGSGSLPTPTTCLFGRAVSAHYWLWVRGVRAWRPVTNPTARALASWLYALWGRHEGAWGGAPLAWVWDVRGLALSPLPTTRPFRRAAGAHYPLAVGGGGAGVGTRHQPHSARSCKQPLRAVGAAPGHPGGAPLACVLGVRGRAPSHPRPLVLSGVPPGPTTHWLWVRGATAGAPASWLCALWGQHVGARGGHSSPGCWASRVGRSPTPDHSSFRACGRGPLPTGCGYGRCGCGAHH